MKSTTIALLLTLSITAASAQANDSVQHSGQASKHSVLALGHGAVSTGKIASAVIAAPVLLAGSVALSAGNASVQTGASIVNATSKHHHHGPLVITETTITADPAPNRVVIVQKKQSILLNQ